MKLPKPELVTEKKKMRVSSITKKLLSAWGIALIIAVIWFYSGDNQKKAQHYMLGVWNGDNITLNGNNYKINGNDAVILSESVGMYQLIINGTASEVVLVRSVDYSIDKMIGKGVIEEIPVLSIQTCSAFLFADPERVGFKVIVRYTNFPIEVVLDESESLDTLKNVFCKLITK
jgi:hypothetical protein